MEERLEALWDPTDLPGTERMLAGFQLQVKGTGDPLLLISLLVRLARCQTLQGRFEHAQETLNDIDFVLRGVRAPAPRQRALAALEKARFFAAAGWEERSQEALREARDWAQQLGDDSLTVSL